MRMPALHHPRYPAAVLVAAAALVLTACGSGSGTAAGTSADTGTSPPSAPSAPSAPSDAGSPPASGGAGTTQSLAEWTTQVCAATLKLREATATPDVGAIASDPEAAMAKLVKSFQKLPGALEFAADELQNLGPPDVPGGQEFTDSYVEGLPIVAAALRKGLSSAENMPVGPLALHAVIEPLQAAKVRTAMHRMKVSMDKIESSPELSAAYASNPTCKKLKTS